MVHLLLLVKMVAQVVVAQANQVLEAQPLVLAHLVRVMQELQDQTLAVNLMVAAAAVEQVRLVH
jgi:hypothetical protein